MLGEKEQGRERVFESKAARESIPVLAFDGVRFSERWALKPAPLFAPVCPMGGTIEFRFGELKAAESIESRECDVELEADAWSKKLPGRFRDRIGFCRFSRAKSSSKEF